MFPVRDARGGSLGFAGLATHLGPSWPMWVISPDAGLYRRSQAVFGLDRAATRIKATRTAMVLGNCVEVLKAHQAGQTNAVTVHYKRGHARNRSAGWLPGSGAEPTASSSTCTGIDIEPEIDTGRLLSGSGRGYPVRGWKEPSDPAPRSGS